MNTAEFEEMTKKISRHFYCLDRLHIISPLRVFNYLWSQDPVFTDGGVATFCLSNGFLSDNDS